MSKKWSFNHSISKEMIDAIDRAEGGWINQYIDDPDLFMAMRDNSINFYYRGNSVLKLILKGEQLEYLVHYKYLLRPYLKAEGKKDQPYVSYGSDFVLPTINPKEDDASKWLKAACKPYSGQEKEGVHKIIKENKNIVDVELSFSREDENGQVDGLRQNRIDFCALRDNGHGLELCFYEAKHFSNSELKAKGEPKVAAQINRYNKTIKAHSDEIHSAYMKAFEQTIQVQKSHPARKYIEKALKSGFSISDEVRLVVFGFDNPQKEGFKVHEENLKKHGIKHILMKGNTKDFRVGISK